MMQSRVWADFPLKSKRCDAIFSVCNTLAYIRHRIYTLVSEVIKSCFKNVFKCNSCFLHHNNILVVMI